VYDGLDEPLRKPWLSHSRHTFHCWSPAPHGHGSTLAKGASGPWKDAVVKMTTLADAPEYDKERFVAAPLLDGSHSNVRVIRLSPGQVLPPHMHPTSDLMIYIVEGSGSLDIDGSTVAFVAGSLAFFRGDEELRLANNGASGLTALAFLAPPFPLRAP
jgi:quercetin dioxygenase-like cupin family protein